MDDNISKSPWEDDNISLIPFPGKEFSKDFWANVVLRVPVAEEEDSKALPAYWEFSSDSFAYEESPICLRAYDAVPRASEIFGTLSRTTCEDIKDFYPSLADWQDFKFPFKGTKCS